MAGRDWSTDLGRRPPAYLGDATTAAGFRLAGLDAHAPEADQLLPTFRELLTITDLLLLGATAARSLPPSEVNAAVASGRPLVVVVPDIHGETPMRDLKQRLRRELGVDL
ncbi:H+-ATPase subunit F/Vma7 [Thiohalospira halophila DSM 15071]|uniref:H+-ATPase subunit F/Vma7 n=1 Tax=Thiohalospira halophila DSM 15071 TaxID=1123397 RepID=A0A1I1NJS1_9GAMM|nr:V-type ATP synthase subunit F [Thiohalospira halophila]SFC97676.1 H+-ATPase subunit F/Vma7 [Thiohalospira halophila DSM 15071]